MTESITLAVNLQAFVRRDTPRRWIATCPMVGIATQGKTLDDAKRCIQEAVELWFESCVERGVLDQALPEANFRPFQGDRSQVDRKPAPRSSRPRKGTDILGEAFEIRLTIPAYEASTLLGATA